MQTLEDNMKMYTSPMVVQFNNEFIYMIIHFYKLSIIGEHRRVGWKLKETEPGFSGKI